MESQDSERCHGDRIGKTPDPDATDAAATILRRSGTPVRQIRPATLRGDGYMLRSLAEVHHPCFRALQEAEYSEMRPGLNAKNKLARKIGWGAYQGDRFVWSVRREYSPPPVPDPEAGGVVRLFDTLSPAFLNHPTTQSILRSIFLFWDFEADGSERPYHVGLTAIRHEPTFVTPAPPSPIETRRGMVDGAIVVLGRTDDTAGGRSRIYGLDRRPLAEVDLKVGDALFLRDRAVLHRVTPLLRKPGQTRRRGQRAFRDVLVVRFRPVGR